jgi:anaerobic selenocysteine-containing dehydrogenase
MAGAPVHGDFEHCEVAVFLGKNPWQSHGFARTRVILREIQNDPNRAMIVIDPRRSETAKMADFHLAVKPGTDAWCLSALSAILVQENLVAKAWLDEHTTGYAAVEAAMTKINVAEYAKICGVDESLLRSAARRIASAKSVSMIEDLGVQMSLHSTLNSYLNRLVWQRFCTFPQPLKLHSEHIQKHEIWQACCASQVDAQPSHQLQGDHGVDSVQRHSR